MTDTGTKTDPVDALVDGIASTAVEAFHRGDDGKGPKPGPDMKGRLPAPGRRGPWVARNGWRLFGSVAGLAVFLVVVWSVFPLGDLLRGAESWVESWWGGGQRFGPSRFDECWAGGESEVCGPSVREITRTALLVGGCVAGAVVWFRGSELFAAGDGPVGRWALRRRRQRLLAGVSDEFYFACVELGFVAPPRPLRAAAARLLRIELKPRAQASLSKLRMDMTGGVVADLRYTRLARVKLFEGDRNVESLKPALVMRGGHKRRVPRGPGWLRPLTFVAALAAGERSYVLTPTDIHFGEHPMGGGRRVVRFLYPDLDASFLECDTDPAPDQARIRIALGQDVICWDRDEHAHLGVYGPTNMGKGHIERRVVWQALQVGQFVMLIDGQAGSEHALFKGLPNYWWFDPDEYHDQWGQTLAPWVSDGLSPEQQTEAATLLPDQLEHVAHLVYVRNQLSAAVTIGRARNVVARRNLGQGWHDWSAADQQANPRINVVIDEGNTLLAKGAGPGKLGEALRKEIGALIGVLLFGGRKYGIHVTLGAQILYSASWMARGMYAQLGMVVVTGSMPPQHQKMTTEVSPWPRYPDERGYGVVARYARPPAEAVRFPPAWPRVYAPLVADLIANAVQVARG